jgi:NAD+ synthetase
MKIALAQLNPIVGDIAGNTAKMSQYIDRAAAEGAELVVFAELSVVGYPPRDLLRKDHFIADNLAAVETLAKRCTKIAALVGFARPTPSGSGRPLQNCAALLGEGKIIHVHAKSLLPTYDVFDETRYFEPGGATGKCGMGVPPMSITGILPVSTSTTSTSSSLAEQQQQQRHGQDARDTHGQDGHATHGQDAHATSHEAMSLADVGISICEDLWDPTALGRPLYSEDPIAELMRQKAKIIINMAASPYHIGKATLKESLFARQAKRAGVPIVYVNQVGGNDELIFDGGSCVISAEGKIVARAKSFEEDLLIADLDACADHGQDAHATHTNRCEPQQSSMQRLWQALKLGLRDYVTKCGFKSAVLGLSGGIDSAIVAALAADALGPDNVYALAMPSRYSSDHSLTDAQRLAESLGIHYQVLPIEPVHAAYCAALDAALKGGDTATADENVQARIRGNIIMAWSNAFGHLALATGNKSELSTGYCTLYGDMAGGLAVIGDVFKTNVFRLARQVNTDAGRERIAQSIIDKPPSAELKPNQFDQDKLPPYDLLDRILERYVERDRTARQIIEEGFDPAVVNYVVRLVDYSEYKRKQAAPVLKATARAFGTGRRMPIAQRYRPSGDGRN